MSGCIFPSHQVKLFYQFIANSKRQGSRIFQIRNAFIMKHPLLISCFVIALSCKHEKKELPSLTPASPSVNQETSSAKIYKGLFVTGKNIRSFRSCEHEDEDYFVVDSTNQMEELYHTIFLHTPAFPYEYVYVELKGITKPATEDLAAKGFDSLLVVKEIRTFEQKNYRNTCIPYDFWGIGNEPNWSLQVSQKENIIALKDYSTSSVYLFEYFPPKIVNDEVFIYSSNNYANQTSLNAVFKKETCSDGMSENEYGYSVSILINGKRYKGCAIKGSENP